MMVFNRKAFAYHFKIVVVFLFVFKNNICSEFSALLLSGHLLLVDTAMKSFNIIYNYRYNIISSEFSVLHVDTYVKILINQPAPFLKSRRIVKNSAFFLKF